MTKQPTLHQIPMTHSNQQERKITTPEKKRHLSCQSIDSKLKKSEDSLLVTLEKGEVDDTITTSIDRPTDEPIVVAIPLGSAPLDGNNSSSATKSKRIRFDESSPVFKTTLAVVCSGTILLGCAVIGTLVAKGIQHYRVLDFQEDWS